jgi:hypothetical protein
MGKESYPSLAFECITDFDCCILEVFGPQFGSNNYKHIVKIYDNIHLLNEGWLSKVEWQYYAKDESIATTTGVYVICDNGYICWPTMICPFMGSKINDRLEDYFSSKVESLWKDVECMFGIIKRRWASLDKGFKYLDIETCGHMFMTCAVLHNMMLSKMLWVSTPPCLQRGAYLASSGMWLEEPLEIIPVPATDDATRWMQLYHHHLCIWKDKVEA